jgi:hypothetical protein
MWLLSWLPDSLLFYVVNAVFVAGAVSFFLSFFVLHKILNKFPSLAPYNLLIQIVSTVLWVAGIYFQGGYGVEMEWRSKVAELEAKVAVAEAQSKDANTALDKKTKEKVKIVKEVQVVIKERIKEVEKRIDADCKVDPEAINIINDAAKNQVGKKK